MWFVFWVCFFLVFVGCLGFFNSYINTVWFINKCCVVHLAYVIRNDHSTVCMPGSDSLHAR